MPEEPESPPPLDEPAGAKPPGEDRTLDARPCEPPERYGYWLPVAALLLIPLGAKLLSLSVKARAYTVVVTFHSPLPADWWDSRLALLGIACGLAAMALSLATLFWARGPEVRLVRTAAAIMLVPGLIITVMGVPGAFGSRGCRECPYSSCRESLRQIGVSCRLYADENDGVFPARLQDAVDNRNWLRCPRLPGLGESVGWARPPRGYTYVSGLRLTDPADCVLAFDKHEDVGGNVLTINGEVMWVRRETGAPDAIGALLEKARQAVRKRGGEIRLVGE